MSSRHQRALETVVRIKREEERGAATALRKAREQLLAETERLKTVQRYAADYKSRTLAGARSWRTVRDEKQFLLQLQSTVRAQRETVEREERNVEIARAKWVTSRSAHAAVDKLIGRRAQARQLERERSEQRQTDDHAARISRSRRRE